MPQCAGASPIELAKTWWSKVKHRVWGVVMNLPLCLPLFGRSMEVTTNDHQGDGT